MKVLVTGGCGFIGSHIVDRLVAMGKSVRVFDRFPERFRPPLKGVEYVFGDIKTPADVLGALSNVDTVIHLVSTTVPGTADLDPQADVRDNVLPTINLLEAAVKLGVKRFVYLSSGGTVYGIPQKVPTPEDHPLRPINSYGIVKTTIEHYIDLFQRTRGLSSLVIRASNPYGPRQGHTGVQGVVATFLHRVLHDEPIEIWGDGSVVRDYLYIEDLADLCATAAFSKEEGACNGGSGQGTSLTDLITLIGSVTAREIKVESRPGRAVDVPRSILDMSLAQTRFEWKPAVPLETGIQKTWDWMQKDDRSTLPA